MYVIYRSPSGPDMYSRPTVDMFICRYYAHLPKIGPLQRFRLSDSWLSCWFGSKLWENNTTSDKYFSNTQPSKIFSTEVHSNTVEFSRHTFTKLESLAYIWWTCVLIFSPLWSPLGFNSELSIAIRSQQSPYAQWQLIIFGFSESDQMHLFQTSVNSGKWRFTGGPFIEMNRLLLFHC